MSVTRGANGSSEQIGGVAVRDHLLNAYDLAMHSNAPNYDLRQRSGRARSVEDLERLLFRIVRVRRPELFVEAGAKDARSSRRARKLLPEARVVAFEANPYVHERFRGRNEGPARGIEYRHLALTDRPGQVTFNVRKAADGTPMADGRGSLKDLVDHEPGTEPVTVEATTLDRFFAGRPVGSCVLWVDVEGAAEEVLRGGPDTLAKAEAIFIEVEDKGEWVWGPAWTARHVARHLLGHGLIPIARDYQSRYQYNVLFVSQAVLQDPECRRYLALHRSAAYRCAREEPPPATAPAALPSSVARLASAFARRARAVVRRLRTALRR